jgi:acetylornithine deacetylase
VAAGLDAWGRRHRATGPAGFPGLCLNLAAMEGGLAFNVVPACATLTASVRPAPGTDTAALLEAAEGEARRAAQPDEIEWRVVHAHPPLQTRDPGAFVDLLGEPATAPTDLAFWTEAALLQAAGIDAVVFGPGWIEQAHGADEFVAIAELEAARDTFVRVLS